MPRKSDTLPINNPKLDKRVKLTDEDKNNIAEEYATGNTSLNKLAAKYGVSKRTIHFIVSPEKKERAKQQFKERQQDGRYYDKEKHKGYMKVHRDHKKELHEKGLL